jgi:AcrR family transcriptional regulator
VTVSTDARAETTRHQILRAAARQFARNHYSMVNLDDILAEAEVTKGAMYFHFRSKHALAMAIIEEGSRLGRAATQELLKHRLSALETFVDISLRIARQDLGDDMARAGLHLLESIGRGDGLQASAMRDWINVFAAVVRRAIAEGDVSDDLNPEDVGRQLASLYMGLRQTSNLEKPDQFLADLEKAWILALPGFVRPERLEYLTQFVKRRVAHAIKNTSLRPATA